MPVSFGTGAQIFTVGNTGMRWVDSRPEHELATINRLPLEPIPQDPIPVHPGDHFHPSLLPTPEEAEISSQEPQSEPVLARKLFSPGKALKEMLNRRQLSKEYQQRDARLLKIREAEAKIRRVAHEQEVTQYFTAMGKLRKELFAQANLPVLLPDTIKKEQTENIWNLPILIKEAELKAPNGRPYHLLIEEMGTLQKTPRFPTHPEGTLLKLNLTGPSPERLTHEIWPNANVEYEHTVYTRPETLSLKRGFSRLKHSIERPAKLPDDIYLKENLINRLHRLLNEGE